MPQEFSTASASSKEPAALAATLTQKSAEGWSVVGVVTTASEVTAFLSREASAAAAAPAASSTVTASTGFTPLAASTPAAEPAGWAVAPEPAATAAPATQTMAPISTPSYQPAQQVAATPAVPAGWYADPAGRFDLRYWDGSAWTEHVSRAGQQFTDPPTA